MKTAYHFFYAHAGYSYNPQTETKQQGRARCAKSLAAAEKLAQEEGLVCDWSIDPYIDSSEFSDGEPYALWQCVCRSFSGEHLSSLGGVDFGPDGEPRGDKYARVIEAELAAEHFA